MAFLRVNSSFITCFTAIVFCFLLYSCQESVTDKHLNQLLESKDDTKERIITPESFNSDSARKLGLQIDSIFHFLHKKKGFNGTVLVTKYDQVIFKGAYGYADFYHKDTLKTSTAFQLASVSKQFTAMAIMILKEQGKLNYDDSIQMYIPEFPYHGITIRHLLTHRSGLSNYTYFSDKLWPDRQQPMSNDDVLSLLANHKPAVYYQPDVRFDYSNTGYALLASVVEKVSGISFSSFMRKNIFVPLQMTQTFTFNDNLRHPKSNVATGHTSSRQKRTSDHLDTVLGDKGIFSTVEDLYKWDQALYTQKLVKQESLKEAFTGTKLKKNNSEDYGFGWRINQLESGDTVLYHAGLWHGYTTYILRNPKDHSALIVLSNLPNGSLKYLKEIRQFLYPALPDNTI